ncbi:hypothetical protein RB594_008251 [Gaeumannomyces avenae]
MSNCGPRLVFYLACFFLLPFQKVRVGHDLQLHSIQRPANPATDASPRLPASHIQQNSRLDPKTTSNDEAKMASASTFYDFKPLNKKGEEAPLSEYKGKVVLVVNTASECGFTPQYGGLETVYKKVKETHGDDFVILGFPCNQFGGQEPGTDEEIQSFCQVNYGVSFPIMGKVDVNGDKASPLWKWLKEEQPGIMGIKSVKWNFEKFLIGRDGKVKRRWASTTKPEAIEKDIVKELEVKA